MNSIFEVQQFYKKSLLDTNASELTYNAQAKEVFRLDVGGFYSDLFPLTAMAIEGALEDDDVSAFKVELEVIEYAIKKAAGELRDELTNLLDRFKEDRDSFSSIKNLRKTPAGQSDFIEQKINELQQAINGICVTDIVLQNDEVQLTEADVTAATNNLR